MRLAYSFSTICVRFWYSSCVLPFPDRALTERIEFAMTIHQKRHERIQNNPNAVRFAEIQPWLRDFGFKLERIAGSHHIFRHDVTRAKLNFQPDRSGMAKPYQIRQALKAIEELP
jgi:hypothetical protein